MRGDSRLDFVAKSLALAGLGVLGVSAALLDRWTATFPPVPSPAVSLMMPAVQVALTPSAPDLRLGRLTPAEPRRQPHATTNIIAKPDAADAEVAPAPSERAAPMPRELPVPMPIEAQPMAGLFIGLSAALPPVVDTWQPMAASLAPPVEQMDEGFFPGVLKRTGSSVGTSLGKASNTVRDAVRVVGDAVKRAF